MMPAGMRKLVGGSPSYLLSKDRHRLLCSDLDAFQPLVQARGRFPHTATRHVCLRTKAFVGSRECGSTVKGRRKMEGIESKLSAHLEGFGPYYTI